MDAIPALPGSYILHLKLPEPERLVIGRLGVFDFPPGDYLYLGSAHGPGGLRGRLKHHLSVSSHPHWHIDYLRQKAILCAVCYTLEPGSLECAWSQALQRIPGAQIPAPGFGATDCKKGCPAHLVAFPLGVEPQLSICAHLNTLKLKDRSFIEGQNRVK